MPPPPPGRKTATHQTLKVQGSTPSVVRARLCKWSSFQHLEGFHFVKQMQAPSSKQGKKVEVSLLLENARHFRFSSVKRYETATSFTKSKNTRTFKKCPYRVTGKQIAGKLYYIINNTTLFIYSVYVKKKKKVLQKRVTGLQYQLDI